MEEVKDVSYNLEITPWMQTPWICSSVLDIGSYLCFVISVSTAFLFEICHYLKKLTQPFLHLFNLPTNIELIVEITQSVFCNSSTTLSLLCLARLFSESHFCLAFAMGQ
jgi:hypothetical protein